MSVKMKGIDVSHWQGTIDFNKVKAAGYEFVIIKAGGTQNGRTYKDSKFETYYADAKAAGLHVGAYYYTSEAFCTALQGQLEAKHFLTLCEGKQFDMPVYADVEEVPTAKGKVNITAAVVAFCEALEAANMFAGVYGSDVSGFSSRMVLSSLMPYAQWVARYNTTGPKVVKTYGMWQYGGGVNYLGSTKVNGVSSSACDQDYCYVDYPSIIRAHGMNGYAAPAADNITSEETTKATDVATEEVAPQTNSSTVTLAIGPVSAGDRARFEALAAELAVGCKVIE